MSTLPRLPDASQRLVHDPTELLDLCARLKAAGMFAFDTEFIGENTYQPVLCLVQVATEEWVELIDPFALREGDGLAPLWALLGDPEIVKLCHAGDQDVEIAWQQSGLVAQNVFDTQIGAGMMGVSYPTALWRAVEYFTGVTLEKAHTYSAWDRRPLSRSQWEYAVDDVRYLPAVYAAMKQRIEELGNGEWMKEACAEMCAEAARPVDPRRLFAKVRGAAGLSGMQLSVLREIVALREQIAYEHDVPARTFLKDDVLLDIATRMPGNARALGAIRAFPEADLASYGPAILEAIARARALPEEEQPSILSPGEDTAEIKRLGETLWVAAQAICLGQGVTPSLVTSQSEVLALARLLHRGKSVERHALMTGWHRACLGEKLTAFLGGRETVNLRMDNNEMRAGFASPAS